MISRVGQEEYDSRVVVIIGRGLSSESGATKARGVMEAEEGIDSAATSVDENDGVEDQIIAKRTAYVASFSLC